MPGRTPARRPRKGARPASTRPVRRTGTGGAAAREKAASEVAARQRPRFTSRMAVLVAVVAVLIVSYASSMRAYLQQHSQIESLQGQIASSKSDIASLKAEKARWNDNAYVEEQARERFGWVLPGETAYEVVGADGKPVQGSDQLTDPATVGKTTTPTPWWSKAYSSLEAADHPVKPKTKPVPPKKIGYPSSSASPSS